MVPKGGEAEEYFPPPGWTEEQDEETANGADGAPASRRQLLNGRDAPGRRDFSIRLREVQLPNSTGYDILGGKIKTDQNFVRIAHFRRFWEGLDGMASYWDTSLDEYIPPKPTEDKEGSVTEQLKVNTDEPEEPKLEIGSPSGSNEPRKRARIEVERPNGESYRDSESSRPPGGKGDVRALGSYRGHRMGNGAGMPDSSRLDTVKAFIEPLVWPFGLTIQPPRRAPLLAIGNVLVPVRLSFTIWRIPSNRQRAQARFVEGPVIGVSCRSETGFREDSTESICDMTSEVAALLLLAQERAREGQTETKPGEGKWWTTVPRWGGGAGGEIGEASKNDDDRKPVSPDGAPEIKIPPNASRPPAHVQRLAAAKKNSGVNAWKTLKPGQSTWEPRVIYERIGKDPDSSFDEVCPSTTLASTSLTIVRGVLDIVTQSPHMYPEDENRSTLLSATHIRLVASRCSNRPFLIRYQYMAFTVV